VFVKGVDGEEGEVVAINGNRATVRIQANESCEKCGLCRKISSNTMELDAYSTRPLTEGEKVRLAIRPGIIVQSAFILYLLPLIWLVAGYYFGKFLNSFLSLRLQGELFPALLSMLFLFASFFPIHMYDKKKRNDNKFKVFVVSEQQ